MHHIIAIFVILSSLICSASVRGESEPLIFAAPQAKLINTINNDSLDKVNTIAQCDQGYIWLGTDKGLVRYDGANIKRFTADITDNSLTHNRITAIIQANQKDLWVATDGGGLNKFTAINEQFNKISLITDDTLRQYSDNLNAMVVDQNKQLWVASDRGLKLFDTLTETPKNLPEQLSILKQVAIKRLFIDASQSIWVLTNNNGVYQLYNQNGQMQYAHFDVKSAQQITQDKHNQLWLGTLKGLYAFDQQQQQFIAKNKSPKAALNHITTLIADSSGDIWLGTQNQGIVRYHPKTERYEHLSGEADTHHQFSRNAIFDMHIDQQNSLWIATRLGLIHITQIARSIRYLTNKSQDLVITDIEPLPDGSIALIGNHQYFQWQPQSNHVSQKMADKNRIYRFSQNSQGELWLATLGQGLQHFDPTTNQIIPTPAHQLGNSASQVTRLYDAITDHQDQVWLLPFPDLPFLAGGVLSYTPSNEQYEMFIDKPFVKDMLPLDDNEWLLVSDSTGLMTLNTQSKNIRHWHIATSNVPIRTNDAFKDSQDNLWFATASQGLARYQPQDESFSYITTNDGLLSDRLESIIEDRQGNLWLGSDKGLSRYNPQKNSILNITRQEGLLISEFYKRSATIDNEGVLHFGTQSGLVSLDPQSFDTNTSSLKVYINDFKLLNKSVDWQTQQQNNPLSKPIEFTQKLILDHQSYMFSFGFAASDYINPEKITFAYQMEGLDDQWVYTNGNNRVASYTTLRPNTYQFKVKAIDQYGNWSANQAKIEITILPPWWLSVPAYAGYLTLTMLCAYLFTTQRTRKLVRHAVALEKSVATRTHELKQSRDQVSQLLEQKQQLFASVSHEFRTPLTLILSPVEHLLSDERGKPIVNELQLIKRNSRRLLRMVDQLLEFAKLEQHQSSQKEKISLKQTLDIIVPSFEMLVKNKNISLSMAPFSDVTLTMLPDSLNKILINILSNAFKYSPEDSAITLTITEQSSTIAIAIKDTGVGISECDLDAVFQRFNRATHGHTEAVPGAGIGLALVKELVEANDGTISLQSTVGEGSTFTVTLPCTSADEHISNHEYRQDIVKEHLDLEIDSINTTDIINQNRQDQDSNQIISDTSTERSVLIIDDNPDLRHLLTEQLSQEYQCISAENGQIGLTLAKEQLPDLIISDVMMPVMDGFELTSKLKQDPLTSHIPVILLTAKGSTENRIKGLQLLADDYLAKPFNMTEVKIRIHNILAIREIIKQKYKQAVNEPHPEEKLAQISANDVEQQFIQQVNQQINNYYTDSDFSAKILSKEIGVSERQLQRKLKAQFDLSFPELLRNYRLNKALEMLQAGQRVSQIYHEVGFSSHSYFSSCFKAKFDKTPKAYQQELENQ